MTEARMVQNGDISFLLRSSLSKRPFRKQAAVDLQEGKVTPNNSLSSVHVPAVSRVPENVSMEFWVAAASQHSSPDTSRRSDSTSDSLSDSTCSQFSSDASYGGRSHKSINTTSSDSDNSRFYQEAISDSDNRIETLTSSSSVTDDEADARKILMLMKVILYLRQNCTSLSKIYFPHVACTVRPNSRRQNLYASDRIQVRKRTISFSPVALLFSAVAEKSFEEAKAIMDTEDVDVNKQSPSGQSLLHIAAGNADMKCIDLLLQSGSRVNIRDSNGWTPLHAAIRRGNWKSAIVLIEAGADIAEYAQQRIREYQTVLRKSKDCYRVEEIFV